MNNILLAWELGAGLGHLGRLAPVATHLRHSGHNVDLAARDLRHTYPLFGDAVGRFYQAPHHAATRAESIAPTLGFIHVLSNIGFSSSDGLHALVRGWLSLFEATAADAIIADYSPTAIVAAHVAGIPLITLGNGFEHPPPGRSCPLFWPDLNRQQHDHIERTEHSVLDNINTVLDVYKKSPLQFASDLYTLPSSSLMATLPALDHYGAREGMSYYGLIRSTGGAAPQWPTKKRPRIYAYLKPVACLPQLFASMTKLGLNTLVYQNNLPPDLIEKSTSQCIRFTAERLDLDTVAREADVALLNATHATLGQLLAGGIPCAMAPLHPEQTLLAHRIQDYGAGVVVDHRDEKHIVGGIQEILLREKYRDAAKKYAEEHAEIDQDELNRNLFAHIDECLDQTG